jgi:hypothetical protein
MRLPASQRVPNGDGEFLEKVLQEKPDILAEEEAKNKDDSE